MSDEEFVNQLGSIVEQRSHDKVVEQEIKREKLIRQVEADLITLSKCFFMPKNFVRSLIEKYNNAWVESLVYQQYCIDIGLNYYENYLALNCCGCGDEFPAYEAATEMVDCFRLKGVK
jgi:hypothetical protein